MPMPVLRSLVARRILVNYRADPEAVRPLLPVPFRPRLLDGSALVGVCLIRLEDLRPRGVPAGWGLASENAAHRIAVCWDEGGGERVGVYIPRRDSGSACNVLAAGRLGAGRQHAADFRVRDSGAAVAVEMRSRDGRACVRLRARVTAAWPADSVFDSVEAASAFFADAPCGFSPRGAGGLCGLELRAGPWRGQALGVEEVASSYFAGLPASLDSALLVRNVPHEWHAVPAPG